jgi:hypothetical protein
LIPFFLAVEHVFRRVYTERTLVSAITRGKVHLDGLAYTIANLVPVLVYDERDGGTRTLTKDEMNRGLFRDGGQSLHFLDGRPVLRNLALRAVEIEGLVAALIKMFPVDDDT